MRRVNVWLLVPAIVLALGVGVLVGRAGDDGGDTAADTPTRVLGQQFERDETTTTEAETTTTAAPTTTTTAAVAAATPTTVRSTTATTRATTATTTTTRRAAGDCGNGPSGASADLTVTRSAPPSDPVFTYSGPARVENNTGGPIELTALVLHLVSSDGTTEDVTVAGGAGAVLESGTTRDFAFTHQTSHPPGAIVPDFAYKPPGGTTNCAST